MAQSVAVPVPLTVHVTPPLRLLGAVAPAVPVTVAVKVRVTGRFPLPLPTKTTVGVT